MISLTLLFSRLKPHKQSFPTAALATALMTVVLILLWYPTHSAEQEMTRFGDTLARTVAHMSAGHLVHKDRIELAVLANELVAQPEVAGVAFYNTTNDILAMSGTSELIHQYTAAATLDDTITGYVSIVLNAASFQPGVHAGRWLLTILAVCLIPLITVALLQITPRGNRSLPIVAVPEKPVVEPQVSFALYVNLHNQLALSGHGSTQALQDALTMAREVGAVHSAVSGLLDNRGVILLFDRKSVDADQALCASALLQSLLEEFETDGEFRCYLDTASCQGAPTELNDDELTELIDEMNWEDPLVIAAMAKPGAILFSETVARALGSRDWVAEFQHPMLDDRGGASYVVEALPDAMAELVTRQSRLILGFS